MLHCDIHQFPQNTQNEWYRYTSILKIISYFQVKDTRITLKPAGRPFLLLSVVKSVSCVTFSKQHEDRVQKIKIKPSFLR